MAGEKRMVAAMEERRAGDATGTRKRLGCREAGPSRESQLRQQREPTWHAVRALICPTAPRRVRLLGRDPEDGPHRSGGWVRAERSGCGARHGESGLPGKNVGCFV